MKTVIVPVSVLETLIEGLQSAVNVCYNVDSRERVAERSYPYAVVFSESTMKWIIKSLEDLKDSGK